MCKSRLIILVLFSLSAWSCQDKATVQIPTPTKTTIQPHINELDTDQLNDKVLGALVGSAIGDAMGASTEMWDRHDIQASYGYIDRLTPAIREQSPEGTWQHDLVAGATTDDTRWKYLMGQYILQNSGNYSAKRFASFINNYYDQLVGELNHKSNLADPDQLDAQNEKIDWIKEWARVTKAMGQSPKDYDPASARFYGGEMSCAGLLYSPMIGIIAANPEQAYTIAYDHAIFDIGYAKDITSMAAVMTHLAMYGVDFASVVDSSLYIDPYGYRDSRLIGRLLLTAAEDSKKIILAASKLEITKLDTIQSPENYTGTPLEWYRLSYIYNELYERKKEIAFHSGEIWQILYTGLLYGNGDFRKTINFIVNYGRDNDTVAAIAGMILGAHVGFESLPQDWKLETIRVNREVIGMDLEKLARDLTNMHVSKSEK